jgi:cephalosporin-C deacetylase-like acetyl esterase
MVFWLAWSASCLCCAGQASAATAAEADWTETGGTWQTHSYWQDPRILQRCAFSTNAADKIVGRSSVEVHLEVGVERPNHLVELRLILPKPLDLSKVEAIEVWLRQTAGDRLVPRDVFLCNPEFGRLTIAAWPEKFELSPGRPWQRAVLDLTEARVLDKANPAADGQYDRHDVATICLNFTLPEGRAVDARLAIDGLAAAQLPAPAVRVEKLPDGSHVFSTSRYRVVIGPSGYLQSLRAGPTEFLAPYGGPAAPPPSASACYPGNDPAKGVVPLGSLTLKGRTRLESQGKQAAVKYAFREDEFDVLLKQDFAQAGYLWFALSPEVIAALDGRTDHPLYAAKHEEGDQIDTRLMTRTGAVLACKQHLVGYSRMSMANLPGGVWAFRHLAYGPELAKVTLRPIPEPSVADAVGFRVACSNPDFLLPGGKPVRFDVSAVNYARSRKRVPIAFQVCDYLTRQKIGGSETTCDLRPAQELEVPHQASLSQPGPYRARFVIDDRQGHERAIEWIFVYDFPNYRPPLTRQPDFKQFWKDTLAELAKIPMDAKVTPVPEQSDATAEAFRVSLATLGGRRVWCWYWKPRKPGRYPVQFQLPSSGVYPFQANHAPHGGDLCGMWMAIHGLPVDFDPQKPPQDPTAWNYWTHGISSPKTSMWRTIYASMVRGLDFLCSREEVDAKRIMVAGGSQGGGLSMVLAGLDRRVAMAAPAHSGLARLDWTVLHAPGFWPFGMGAKPPGQSTEQFLATLSYFDAANFTPDIACPLVAEVSLLDTVTASGNQICALAHVKPGLLELICDPWTSHASDPRGASLRADAIHRWLKK